MSRILLYDLREKELSVSLIDSAKKTLLSTETFARADQDALPEIPLRAAGDLDESYLSLPMQMLDFRVIEMPFSDIRKIRELLPLELDGLILGGTSTVIFDALLLGQNNGSFKILVAYIHKAKLKKILDHLHKAGADPKAAFSLELSAALANNKGADASELLSFRATYGTGDLVSLCLNEISRPSVNFRRGELAYTVDDTAIRKKRLIAAVLAGLAALLFVADMGLQAFSLHKENRTIRDEIRKAYKELFPNEKKIADELYQMKAHLRELRDKETSFVGVSPLASLLAVSKVMRPGISLSELSVEKELIVFKGECAALSDAEKVKTDLEQHFSDVNISETRPGSQGKTLFTITSKGRRP